MLKNRRQKTYAYLGFCFIFIIFLHYIGWLHPVEYFFRTKIFSPALSSLHNTGSNFRSKFEYFKDKDGIMEEYASCLEKTEELEFLRSKIMELENENMELKEIAGFVEKEEYEFVSAAVISKNIDSTQKTITVGVGEEEGIKVNQPVITGEGILIGKVIKVEEDISIIRLISDNQSKISGAIFNEDESLGMVEGGYGITLRMKFIPRNEIVMIGDKVITSNLDENMPKGFLIGTVVAVENESYKPFQQAVVESATQLEKIDIVSILLVKEDGIN